MKRAIPLALLLCSACGDTATDGGAGSCQVATSSFSLCMEYGDGFSDSMASSHCADRQGSFGSQKCASEGVIGVCTSVSGSATLSTYRYAPTSIATARDACNTLGGTFSAAGGTCVDSHGGVVPNGLKEQ